MDSQAPVTNESTASGKMHGEPSLMSVLASSCWNCEARTRTEIVYLIPHHDPALGLLSRLGFIQEPLQSPSNMVPLCPTCRANFDSTVDPGFVFLPVDLKYFMQYEENDYQNRCQQLLSGRKIEPRTFPTARNYLDHQIKQGVVRPTSTGGLYRRVFFKNFLPPATNMKHLELPKTFNGSPIATIRRAFQALGSLRCGAWSEVRDDLFKLQGLYSRCLPETPDLQDLAKPKRSVNGTRVMVLKACRNRINNLPN
ncbi:conserved hypothetical protein [Coccidioides posadasii str. Silveira]|uniref:Uncharacterized protein n=1 Tax=Coccidioides posadasii (strain RMSCC 757 / Silveira) TaxID=443226 RepID=E9CUD3_COCPS|nr:conserved hypothetical protein [Coccidioides posadasii str. Silveira]